MNKTQETKEIETQRQCEQLVRNEVIYCQSALVDEMLKKEVFSIDDIENLSRPYEKKVVALTLCNGCNSEVTEVDAECGVCLNCYTEDPDDREPLEWWIVSNWLIDRLRENGEVVLDNDYGTWWGRQTSGQSVYMDGIIRKINRELEETV